MFRGSQAAVPKGTTLLQLSMRLVVHCSFPFLFWLPRGSYARWLNRYCRVDKPCFIPESLTDEDKGGIEIELSGNHLEVFANPSSRHLFHVHVVLRATNGAPVGVSLAGGRAR
jgi:hypothetical protein